MRRYFVSALAVVCLGACSGGEKVPDVTGARDRDTVTTVADALTPSTGLVGTTTTIDGTPVSDQEIYAEAGLTPEQANCVEASGVNGEFTATPGPSALDAIVLESGERRVAVPASVRTSTELEVEMLSALATDCAPADLLARLAAIDGLAADDAAIADDLPKRLDHRRANGATPTELACLDAAFRESPARLSSLVATPEVVEAGCASPDRRADWRHSAIDAGLKSAGATASERICLVGTASDLVDLSTVADAVAAGDTSQAGEEADFSPTCVTAKRLFELALGVVAKSADFGAESLAP